MPDPVAHIAAAPTFGTPPLEVTFTGAASTADDEIVEYSWDFGDSSAVYESSEPGTSHTFSSLGEYTVTLTVTDSFNEVSSTSVEVVVSNQWAPTIATPPNQPGTEVWYDYNAFAIEHSISITEAISVLTEATFILSELTDGQIHGERCWQDTYRAPATPLLTLEHYPISSVSWVRKSHSCSEEFTDVDFCVVSDRVLDVRKGQIAGFGSCFLYGDWSIYGSYELSTCGCRPMHYVVEYTEASTLIPGSDRVAKKLAEEYLKAKEGKPCALPERITSVSRQGMSWTILDPQDFLERGLTGVSIVDHWLSAVRHRTNRLKMRDPLAGALLKSVPVSCDYDAPLTAAEDRLWTRRRGDDWRWQFSTADNIAGWDDTTVLVQVRTGTSETDTLIATSETAESVTANITVDADFSSQYLSWHIDDLVTSTISPGVYQLEVQCEIDGDLRTILSHWLKVTPQVALLGLGS